MDKIIFFAALIIFPFGQLFKIGFVNLFDITVLVLAIATLWKKPKYPEWYKYFSYFLLSCIFGLVINYNLTESYTLFTTQSVLYLIRLWSYSMIAVYILNNRYQYKLVRTYLLAIAVVSAIFGWIQYFVWSDLTALKYLGWDDHLLRMVGTFLDPTYLGLILVLGIIMALDKYPKVMYFLLFSLAFTYSRASYLAAFLILFFKKKNIALIFFILIVLLLPKNIGEGTNLARTVSGNNKLLNYLETIEIIKKSPVVGVGFNNICEARQNYLKDMNIVSHACNGSDSSILFLIATTGVTGLFLFLNAVRYMPNNTILKISIVALLVHSLFANSLFYPHIMFWMFCLVGLQTEVNSKSS